MARELRVQQRKNNLLFGQVHLPELKFKCQPVQLTSLDFTHLTHPTIFQIKNSQIGRFSPNSKYVNPSVFIFLYTVLTDCTVRAKGKNVLFFFCILFLV